MMATAGKATVVEVEEIVEPEVIRADPNRTLIPAHAVDAVCVVPQGAHPSYVQGSYDRDCAFYREWTPISKDPQRLREWLDTHVRSTADHAEYLDVLGRERMAGLAVGFGVGFGLDRLLGTTPILLVIFIFLGFAAGVKTMLRTAAEMGAPPPATGTRAPDEGPDEDERD